MNKYFRLIFFSEYKDLAMSNSMITSMYDFTSSNNLFNFVNNPIHTSIVIILIMLLIIFIMFRSEYNPDSSYSFWILLFRSGFYLLIPIVAIVCIHYKHIEQEFENKYENKILSNTINSTIEQKITGENEYLLNGLMAPQIAQHPLENPINSSTHSS